MQRTKSCKMITTPIRVLIQGHTSSSTASKSAPADNSWLKSVANSDWIFESMQPCMALPSMVTRLAPRVCGTSEGVHCTIEVMHFLLQSLKMLTWKLKPSNKEAESIQRR